MKAFAMIGFAGCCALLASNAAQGDFLGLDIINFTGWFRGTGSSGAVPGYFGQTSGMHPNAAVRAAHNAGPHLTYRFYAVLSPGSTVAAVGGYGTTQSTSTWMSASSGNFFNYVSDDGYGNENHYNLAPTTPLTDPIHAFDTFVTIGRTLNDGATSFAPTNSEFASTTNNLGHNAGYWNSFTGESNVGWFVAGNPAQSVAAPGGGAAGEGNWGVAEDGLQRVLIGQITVHSAAELIAGNFGFLGGYLGGGLGIWEASGADTYWWIITPGPSGLSLLVLAGLAGARRRRA